VGQAWRDWGGVIGVSVCAVPIVVALVAALSRWRQKRGVPPRVAWWRSAAEIGAVAGTLPWIWMILTPGGGPRRVHLVPLRDLAAQLAGDPGTAVAQVGGNLLVFAALGFFAPIRLAALANPLRLAALGAASSVVVEVTQYALDLGRVSSVDDVLLNALGAMLAGLASRRWWQDDVTRPLCTS
jgi:hypothetical protein